MKEVFYNYDNLTKDDIDETVTRIKALIINSSNEILLGYAYGTYQFPGGHLEKDESLEEGLLREVKEETGIKLKNNNLKPFYKIIYYNKNYRNKDLNRENDIYYYIIKTDEKPDINKTDLDDLEKMGNFSLKNIPLDKVEEVLISSIPNNSINEIVVEEMLDVIKEYKTLNK